MVGAADSTSSNDAPCCFSRAILRYLRVRLLDLWQLSVSAFDQTKAWLFPVVAAARAALRASIAVGKRLQ